MSDGTERWERFARRVRVPLGFAFAAVFLWRARPTLLSLLLSLLLVIPGLLLRGYASGYVKKNAELTQTGPYAYTRNPLYLGSMLAAFGFAAASRRLEVVILLAVLFAVIYLPVILSEEKFLRARFTDFDGYAGRVPRLLPRFTSAPAMPPGSAGEFSATLYRQHREYNSLMGAVALYAALLLLLWVRRHSAFPETVRHEYPSLLCCARSRRVENRSVLGVESVGEGASGCAAVCPCDGTAAEGGRAASTGTAGDAANGGLYLSATPDADVYG